MKKDPAIFSKSAKNLKSGIYEHYKAISAASPVPIILYNVPGRTSSNIASDTTLKLAKELGVDNISFIAQVSYKELPLFMAKADICLGVFGDTPKTELVIPNKIYEAIAMKKSVITADTQAVRELLNQDDLLLIKSADPKMLADAILRLKNDPAGRAVFAQNAYKKFVKYATPEILGQQLKNIIQQL